MKKSIPLIVDDALPSHTYLELIHDDAFTPVFFPKKDVSHMRLIKHTHLSGKHISAQQKKEPALQRFAKRCRRFFRKNV